MVEDESDTLISKEAWNKCRNASKDIKTCYAEIDVQINNEISWREEEEMRRMKNMQERLTMVDYWDEFNPAELAIAETAEVIIEIIN